MPEQTSLSAKALLFLKSLPKGLYAHYSAPQHLSFKRLRDGFIYFSVGLILIYIANTAISPSLQQELVTLAGVLLAGVGFFLAMLSYVRIVISRIVIFFSKGKPKTPSDSD